jgi:beclin
MKGEGSGVGAAGSGDKGRALAVDPTLPRWVCQNCRHALCVVGVESYADKFFNDPSRSSSACSFVISHESLIFLCQNCMDHCS